MRLNDEAFNRVREYLVQLGLKACPVCGSESLHADPRPLIAAVGGTPWVAAATGVAMVDDDTDVLHFVRVECEVCGHSLLFNTEKFFKGDDPIYGSP